MELTKHALLEQMINESLTDEDRKLIADGQQLATEWANDGVYPVPNDDAEFFAKYVKPPELPTVNVLRLTDRHVANDEPESRDYDAIEALKVSMTQVATKVVAWINMGYRREMCTAFVISEGYSRAFAIAVVDHAFKLLSETEGNTEIR
jgi:hypothetical protein